MAGTVADCHGCWSPGRFCHAMILGRMSVRLSGGAARVIRVATIRLLLMGSGWAEGSVGRRHSHSLTPVRRR